MKPKFNEKITVAVIFVQFQHSNNFIIDFVWVFWNVTLETVFSKRLFKIANHLPSADTIFSHYNILKRKEIFLVKPAY